MVLCLLAGRLSAQPEPLQYMSFRSQGQLLSMAYVYQKPSQPNGQTVLLLHGKNFSSRYWDNTIRFLNSRGYAVIAPEQLGFGSSSKPLCYQFSFQQLAHNTKTLLDTLGITQAIVLGHSMGGMLATRFALMYPAMCTQLILENPIGLEDWKLKVPYSLIEGEYKKELTKSRQALKDYMIKNYFHGEWKSGYEVLLDDNERLKKGADSVAYAMDMALTSDMICTQPVCYEFKALKVPAVLIIGQEDRTAIGSEKVSPEVAATMGHYPALGKKTAEEIPNCRLIGLDGLGHVPHVENFKAFAQALDRALGN